MRRLQGELTEEEVYCGEQWIMIEYTDKTREKVKVCSWSINQSVTKRITLLFIEVEPNHKCRKTVGMDWQDYGICNVRNSWAEENE